MSLARHHFVAATTLPVRRIQNDPGVVRATGYVEISTLKDSLADSSIFLLLRQIAGTPRESWRLPHIPYAKLSIFLVSHVGTEIALGKIKTATRYLIVSVIDRTIHFQIRKVTMMSDHTKERSMMEHPSRRSFLGMSSVALATAALAGLTANAQEKESTQKAEHDHSSSDPGQENKPLLTENPNSNTPPPTDHGDVVPLWYSFDLVKKRVEQGGWTHEVTTARPSFFQRYCRRQHATHCRQLSRDALAHR